MHAPECDVVVQCDTLNDIVAVVCIIMIHIDFNTKSLSNNIVR